MMMQSFEKKNIILCMAIAISLLPGIFSTDTFGMGELCSPCDHIEFLYCNGEIGWICNGCTGLCGSCYSCNPSGPTCVDKCPSSECKDCNVVSDYLNCPDWYCAGCKSVCNSSDCEECVGGNCLQCGARQYEECCNGECIDTRTQKCCPGLFGTHFICDINSNCCDLRCCDPRECKTCGSTSLSPCKVCDDNPNQKCCDGLCKEKCKIVDGTTCNNTDTDYCRCALPGGECVPSSRTVYSKITEKICNPQGCPGDCSDGTEWCSRTYQCEIAENFTPCAICSNLWEGPDGIPYPGLIYHCLAVEPGLNPCYSCTLGAMIDHTDVENDSCN